MMTEEEWDRYDAEGIDPCILGVCLLDDDFTTDD